MVNCTGNYFHYLEQEKRYSTHTLVAYRFDIQQFSDYLEAQFETADLLLASPQMVRSWLASLMDSGITKSSLNRKLSTLKSFYKYCLQAGLVQQNPLSRVKTVKRDRTLPSFIEEKSLNTLFNDRVFGEDFAGLRDTLIMLLLYTTGIRLSELIGLRHQDVDTYNDQIRVRGKRNKQRLVPMLRETREAYMAYCEAKARNFGMDSDDGVLVTDKGRGLYPKYVYRRVNHYLGQVTTRGKRSPHVLRHSFATHMLDHGADLNAIKEILGHASLSATQVYTHNTIEKIKSIYKQAHPKA